MVIGTESDHSWLASVPFGVEVTGGDFRATEVLYNKFGVVRTSYTLLRGTSSYLLSVKNLLTIREFGFTITSGQIKGVYGIGWTGSSIRLYAFKFLR